MIKKVQHPDGRVEEVTGTPEEIAAYERALRDKGRQDESKKKPGVLKGKESTEFDYETFGRSIEELIKRLGRDSEERKLDQQWRWFDWYRLAQPTIQPQDTSTGVWCQQHGKYNCDQVHVWIGDHPGMFGTTTGTTTITDGAVSSIEGIIGQYGLATYEAHP